MLIQRKLLIIILSKLCFIIICEERKQKVLILNSSAKFITVLANIGHVSFNKVNLWTTYIVFTFHENLSDEKLPEIVILKPKTFGYMHNRRFMSQASRTWHFARSAKRETRGEEKNKAPVASPLFRLFRPRLRPQILTDGGHVKRTNEKLKTRSINRQQHKPQEITTTRT